MSYDSTKILCNPLLGPPLGSQSRPAPMRGLRRFRGLLPNDLVDINYLLAHKILKVYIFNVMTMSRHHMSCVLSSNQSVRQTVNQTDKSLEAIMSAHGIRTEKFEFRLSSAAKQRLEAAASALSRSLSEFVRESALARAEETLADRRTFVLSKAQWDKFQAALDAPTRALPRMQRLLTEPGFFDAVPASSPTTTEER